MNNNKKYKKWSLGLVAPALVLAPIAVVASCSSSGEEKPAYSVSFKQPTLSVEVNNKNVKPSKLSREGFVQEIINNKTNIFNIEDSSGKVTDDFLRENLIVGNITRDDSAKTASAEVTLNNKNTDGGSESATITLTGFDYQEAELDKLEYTITFTNSDSAPQTIELKDKSEVSVTSLNESSLIQLVLEETTKKQILTIDGKDAEKITNDVLENQILEIRKDSIQSDKVAGTIQFELKVLNDGKNTDTKAEIKKEIKFSGFKQETDSTPETKNIIGFKAKTDGKYVLKTVSEKTTDDFGDIETKIKPLIIQEKDVIFEATEGTLPTEEQWWNENLLVSQAGADAPKGEISVTIQLNNSDSSNPSQNIKEENVILSGFKPKPAVPTTGEPTTAKTEVSTVTLGLNGSLAELIDGDSPQINENWVFENKRILFEKGTEPITLDGITSVIGERIGQENNKFNLKFTLAKGKYYGDDRNLATTPKDFTIKIIGVSGGNTTGVKLKYKSGTDPLSIGLVDPELAKGTYQQFIDNAADIFNKDFVFKYRKNLLTGDFSAVDAAGKDGFLKDYDGSGKFVKVNQNDTNKTIEIKFTILQDKLVGNPAATGDEEFSITFKEFKTT